MIYSSCLIELFVLHYCRLSSPLTIWCNINAQRPTCFIDIEAFENTLYSQLHG
jgi:hypothetical protein